MSLYDPEELALRRERQLNSIQDAMARGVKSVTYNGETVTYRSMDEMLQAERRLMRQLGLRGATRRRFPSYNKGL